LNAGTRSVGYGESPAGRAVPGALPGDVSARFASALRRAAQRWSVSASLLAAQLRKESGFDPRARSPARLHALRDPRLCRPAADVHDDRGNTGRAALLRCALTMHGRRATGRFRIVHSVGASQAEKPAGRRAPGRPRGARKDPGGRAQVMAPVT
jgi:hypothetical protein